MVAKPGLTRAGSAKPLSSNTYIGASPWGAYLAELVRVRLLLVVLVKKLSFSSTQLLPRLRLIERLLRRWVLNLGVKPLG